MAESLKKIGAITMFSRAAALADRESHIGEIAENIRAR